MGGKEKKKRLSISLDCDLVDLLSDFKHPSRIIAYIIEDYFKGLSEEQKYLKAARILKEPRQKPARRAPSQSPSLVSGPEARDFVSERPEARPEPVDGGQDSSQGRQKAKARGALHGIPREFYKTG